MGLLDAFRKKRNGSQTLSAREDQNNSDINSIMNFDSFYLYGLANYNPFVQSADRKSFNELYDLVIGNKGGIIIGSALHPYQIVNPKGTTIWHAAYAHLYTHQENKAAFAAIVNEKARFLVDPSTAFSEVNIWPDTRLTNEENPMFSKFVPFIIPFFIYKDNGAIRWDVEIDKAMKKTGDASSYVEYVTSASRFLMKKPSFILGFNKFDEEKPFHMIESFIAFKPMIERQNGS